MLIDIDSIGKLSSASKQVEMLREIKNDMIGCYETKQAYFNNGLIEVVIPLLS